MVDLSVRVNMAISILLGTTLIMSQNVIYALPAKRSIITSSAPIQVSFTEDSGFTELAAGAETALPFAKSLVAGNQISVKKIK